MVRALYDEQANVTVFPFGKLQCTLQIGVVSEETQRFFGWEFGVIEADEMPQSGLLFRCGEHGGSGFLVAGLPGKAQLRCGNAPLTSPVGVSVPQQAKLGKRYVDPSSGIELLCIGAKESSGILSVDGRPMWETSPKLVPSAD
jgi:hypothetical protein